MQLKKRVQIDESERFDILPHDEQKAIIKIAIMFYAAALEYYRK